MGKQVIDFSSQKKKSSKKSISKEKKEVSVDSSPSVACLFWLICFGLGEFDEHCYEAKQNSSYKTAQNNTSMMRSVISLCKLCLCI
jgi:hypothetical protein